MEYIATFFNHFGATRFARTLERANVECKLMPVPRRFSTACGTCVRFSCDGLWDRITDDVEAVYTADEEGRPVYRNEEE